MVWFVGGSAGRGVIWQLRLVLVGSIGVGRGLLGSGRIWYGSLGGDRSSWASCCWVWSGTIRSGPVRRVRAVLESQGLVRKVAVGTSWQGMAVEVWLGGSGSGLER